jgi:hypothetical protein
MLKARVPEASDEIDRMKFGEIVEWVFLPLCPIVPPIPRPEKYWVWVLIGDDSVDESVREDIKLLKEDKFLGKDVEVWGYNLDIFTGLLRPVDN